MKDAALENSSSTYSNQLQSKAPPSNFWLTARTNVKLKQQSYPIEPVPRNGNLPLSLNQERLWFLEQLQPGTSVQNLLHTFHLKGLLNVAALEQSLSEIVRRHEILRTTFPAVNGLPIQFITPNISLQLPVVDLQHLCLEERLAAAQQLALVDAEQPFNLASEPLWRFKLLRLSEDEHMLIRTIHHIIFDGWSHSVSLRELGALYQAFSTGKPSPLPELGIQYADFAQSQRQWLQSEMFSSQLGYWKQQLSGSIWALELPTDYPYPSVPTYRGACQSLVLSENLTEALKKLSYQEGVSLFVTLLAAFKTLLYRYTEQEEMLVCSPIASRHQIETKGLIGYFNNVVAMRTDLSGNPSFRELLSRVSQVTLGASNNQDVPLQQLTELPNLARTPLSRAMFILQNTPNQILNLEGLTVDSLYVNREIANFDLSLSMQEKAGKLTAVVQYKTDLFKATSITQMLEYFQALLENLVTNPEQCLSDLPRLIAARDTQAFGSNGSTTSFIPAQEKAFVAPQDDLELQLAKIWEQVLDFQPISIKDNFFDLGGHSLLAVRLFAQIEKTFDKNLPLATLLQAPTIEQLASILRQKDWSASWSPLVTIQAGGSRPPLFCIHGGGFNVLIYRDLAINLGSDQPVYGLQARGLDGKENLNIKLEDVASDYIRQMRNVQPEGPYFLAGLSAGGTIALEMAQQLHAQGQKVALLAMLDSYGPNSMKLLPPTPRLFSSLLYALRYSTPRFVNKLIRLETKVSLSEVLSKVRAVNKSGDEYRSKAAENQINAKQPTDGIQHLSTNTSYLERWSNNFSLFILEHSPLAFFSPKAQLQGIEGSLTDNIKKLEDAYKEAQKAYTPKGYPGRISLFKASESPPGYHVDPQLGWGKIAAGGLDIYKTPGHHVSIVKSAVLAANLRACVDKGLADTPQVSRSGCKS
jgi:thioesterase domain-containing protein/acyl carrier protein